MADPNPSGKSEEVKKDPTAQTSATKTEPVATPEIAKQITEGLNQGFKELASALKPQPREEVPTPPRPAAPPPIEDVTAEELADAIESGDKTRIATAIAKKDRAADERSRRAINQIRQEGAAAISTIGDLPVREHPIYKRFGPEVRKAIADYQTNNPSEVITRNHWEWAIKVVRGEHGDELEREAAEAAVRKVRDDEAAAAAPKPTNTRGIGGPAVQTDEPTTLAEEFGAGFNEHFNRKSRALNNRSEDEEVKRAGFKGGTKEYLKTRREMQEIEQTNPTFGLDQ